MRRSILAVSGVVSIVMAICFASTGWADTTIADWEFTEGSDFLADSSGNGHTLTKIGTVGDTGGVATFSAEGLLGANLDLTGYNSVKISWRWLVQSDSFGLALLHNFESAGGVSVTANEVAAGDSRVGLRGTNGSYITDRITHAHGSDNMTWENFYAVYNLGAATAEDSINVYKEGAATGTNECLGTVPSSYLNSLFMIGGVTDNGTTYAGAGFVGQIDYVKVESVVPEPGTCILVIAGSLGLLCYAWRKRRIG